MPSPTQAFIDALRHLEETGDTARIAALFADDADISNPLVKREAEGRQGAAAFWRSYRAAFESVASDFRSVVEGDGVALLEWVSEGATAQGPFRYGGVSVIEYDGDRIAAFRSYFDPRHLHAAATPLTAAQAEAARESSGNRGYQ